MRISAQASRDGEFWLVYVPEVAQYTQGRNLEEARLMARDLVASLRGVPLAQVELAQFTVEVPGMECQPSWASRDVDWESFARDV
ncbi:type II toxin-antitoxin system HicB family antitoxin [Gordonia aurantiaca]|uniref:type II toxin-antitoxin system HicB family antitoxin n=1 Tax=Gordonia sp. B21 TaxID=3151852 RepID=UPI00326459F0